MAESSLFMAGKLRKPDTAKVSANQDTNEEAVKELKPKKSSSKQEKPWIGTAALRNLAKKNEERSKSTLAKENPTTLAAVPKVPRVINADTAADEFPIAPTKDFHRVPNSINRVALEGGMFTRPSCKPVYDALYLLTRGAVQPSRTIQIGRKPLQKKAGIGSDKTLDAALISLQDVGLLKIQPVFGNQKGNVYEVFLPEEIETENYTINTHLTQGTQGTQGYLGYKVPTVPWVQSTYGTQGQAIENKQTCSPSNTLLKDNTENDDDFSRACEAFFVMIKKFDEAVKKITGRKSSKTEAEKWGTLAELLILELEVAASRTDKISSVPAFLTEILRRQFFAPHRQQTTIEKPFKIKIDSVGKSDSGFYEIKPLDEKERKDALAQLREFANDGFLNDFEKWYTPDDWEWLMKQLEKDAEKNTS